MLTGFIGDVHGQAFHALAAVATWQIETGRRFDLLIQVGDLGVYPDPARMDAASRRYLAAEPSQGDFARLLMASGERADRLRGLRRRFASPTYFVRGNHEDRIWLRQLPIDEATGTAPVDPFDVFRFVPDGTILRFGDVRIGFLGGAEVDEAEDTRIDSRAHQALMRLGAGAIDVLVTHDAPYGVSVGYHGQIQGSRLITRLVEQLEPTFHVAGHLGQYGPRTYGRTTFLCLAGLIQSALWKPAARGLAPGCLATLDIDTAQLAPVTDPWLARFPTPFDFDAWTDRIGLR